jgi:hypothetical protein
MVWSFFVRKIPLMKNLSWHFIHSWHQILVKIHMNFDIKITELPAEEAAFGDKCAQRRVGIKPGCILHYLY